MGGSGLPRARRCAGYRYAGCARANQILVLRKRARVKIWYITSGNSDTPLHHRRARAFASKIRSCASTANPSFSPLIRPPRSLAPLAMPTRAATLKFQCQFQFQFQCQRPVPVPDDANAVNLRQGKKQRVPVVAGFKAARKNEAIQQLSKVPPSANPKATVQLSRNSTQRQRQAASGRPLPPCTDEARLSLVLSRGYVASSQRLATAGLHNFFCFHALAQPACISFCTQPSLLLPRDTRGQAVGGASTNTYSVQPASKHVLHIPSKFKNPTQGAT